MKIGFIGIGKIASAVIEGLCTSEAQDLQLFLSPRNEKLSTQLAEKYTSIKRLSSNQDVLDSSDIVVIALRPTVAADILKTLKFRPDHTIVSLIPLLKYADLSAVVQPAATICRAIPLPTVMEHNCPIPVYRAPANVIDLFRFLGQPLVVTDEPQLHAIWTLTGLISPFYDLLGELSAWPISHGVDERVANTYVADLFQSLSYMAQKMSHIDFSELSHHAATPNGMNEQAAKEIKEKGAHDAWRVASDRLLERFK
ncbi:MAG: NAD(P)-binding domain-containing protein [Bacteroidetes bacterium]|nr:NAD(P)-binding domain-containing protein [Bacteroidota bacterium]